MPGTGKTKSTFDATVKGRSPDGNTGSTHEGETAGVGQINSAVLNQRPLTSNPRNQGISGRASEIGAAVLPVITAAGRKTGRIA